MRPYRALVAGYGGLVKPDHWLRMGWGRVQRLQRALLVTGEDGFGFWGLVELDGRSHGRLGSEVAEMVDG